MSLAPPVISIVNHALVDDTVIRNLIIVHLFVVQNHKQIFKKKDFAFSTYAKILISVLKKSFETQKKKNFSIAITSALSRDPIDEKLDMGNAWKIYERKLRIFRLRVFLAKFF